QLGPMARTLRTEAKPDPKQQLAGALYSRNAGLGIAERHAEAIQKLANVKLAFKAEAAPKSAAMRSTAEFDLVLELPKLQDDAQRKRNDKQGAQLVKNIANIERQLGDDSFLANAPPHVIETLRKKLAEYKAHWGKIDAL